MLSKRNRTISFESNTVVPDEYNSGESISLLEIYGEYSNRIASCIDSSDGSDNEIANASDSDFESKIL